MYYDLVGPLYNRDGTYNEEGEILTPATLIPGFHVNTTEKLEGLDDYLVTPNDHRPIFSGYLTFHYTFDSEEHARELVPDAFLSETLEDE
jgi:hypothetical protein